MHSTDEKEWIGAWKTAGEALQKIKRQELQSFDYAANEKIIDGLLQWACDHAEARPGSGLVVQQRLFMKLRK